MLGSWNIDLFDHFISSYGFFIQKTVYWAPNMCWMWYQALLEDSDDESRLSGLCSL